MQEIERKYLVCNDSYRREAVRSVVMAQGYLCSRRITARVRLCGDEAYLTFKGKSYDGGLSRFEFERTIPATCARMLLARCTSLVEKVRHYVPFEGHLFEVDEFTGDNSGLVVAEVELCDCTLHPTLPTWVSHEVTGQHRYYNSYLAKRPYSTWAEPSHR
ncbi:MAG: CYTH domain-containing protein [Alistipes sp.]|nr:CYTH domain-containing protein [Alistipes sp.]